MEVHLELFSFVPRGRGSRDSCVKPRLLEERAGEGSKTKPKDHNLRGKWKMGAQENSIVFHFISAFEYKTGAFCY